MSMIIQAEIAEEINFSAVHTQQQFIVEKIQIKNVNVNSMVCKITAVPEFLFEFKTDVIISGDEAVIERPQLILNDDLYRKEYHEAKNGEIKIEVFSPEEPEKILCFSNHVVRVSPYSHCNTGKYPQTMAGFLQPNDPLVLAALERAGAYAAKTGVSMTGYSSRKEDVIEQMRCIYQALQEEQIHYMLPPASFENGQKIRPPHQVLKTKQGTCLCLAVNGASFFQAAGLNPVIILIINESGGHALSGVWLEDKSFSKPVVARSDMDETTWLEVKKNLLPVECTAYTDGHDVEFSTAVAIGKKLFEDCTYLIDVKAAVDMGITPVYTYAEEPICKQINYEENEFDKREFRKQPKTKIELLREQSMDLSTRSRLLHGEGTECFVKFQVNTEELMKAKDAEDFLKKQLQSSDVQKILHELYCTGDKHRRTCGKNHLYFAINELVWCKEENGKRYHAALYLCPAEIYRNGRSEFRLRVNLEEMIFNPALKILLSQEYQLDSSGLKDQPKDDYREEIKFLEFLTEMQENWEILENTARLSFYRIPNEAIWNGLSDEKVLSHEIVKGMLNGKMEWENQLSNKKQECLSVYPFETDSSQKEIIRSAFEKKAQVVVGPAGNGKTTTEVNLMIEALRRGEKVLLVSEEPPAMEIVDEKFNQMFGDMLHLMLLKGKHSSKDMTEHLRRILERLENSEILPMKEDINAAYKKYDNYFEHLEWYHKFMCQKNDCGKSVEELIEMSEKYADCPLEFQLDEICGAIELTEAEDQVTLLAKILEKYDDQLGNYSDYIKYENLHNAEAAHTEKLVKEAVQRYEKVKLGAGELAKCLGTTKHFSEKQHVEEMLRYAKAAVGSGAADSKEALKLSGKLWSLYGDYYKVNRAAAEKIIKNETLFLREHPDIPKTELYKEWLEYHDSDQIRNQTYFEKMIRGIEQQGYGCMVRQIKELKKSGTIDQNQILNGYYKAWANHQIKSLKNSYFDELFLNGWFIQDRAEQLAEKEEVIRKNIAYEILNEQLALMPKIQDGISNDQEFGELQSLLRKKYTTIRDYFEKAPNLLLTLCPCMIMDPAAVAEYIPSDFPGFDLVLIDEGSQMPLYNALIPISKADRCMIFGDEKQLQPVSEFKRQMESEYQVKEGEESVLTSAYITSMPRKTLRFHYRSESESLIAFSNNRYYQGKIYTFPNCSTSVQGVSYEFVEGGFYDREGSKANVKEAEAVIEKIKEIYGQLPSDTQQTLGVITLNIHQRNMICSILNKAIEQDTGMSLKTDELVSVVNLESCQGKEWDYIILSPGFGYDKRGKMSMNFGALNRAHGENRLNVMLTRARKKMYVITSIDPQMLNDAKGKGTRDFRDFLLYAKGELNLDHRFEKRVTEKDGMTSRLARELRKIGYEVHTNIGSSELKVDVGIVSKRNPQNYVLGILIDRYSTEKDQIHDREISYQKNLERKGWKIYRLRMLNWHDDFRRELRQIIKLAEVAENEK